MTRKHLARLCIQCCRGEPRIDCGVLDVGMSQPILHKGQIRAGIKQVRSNGMLQTTLLLDSGVVAFEEGVY